MIGSQSDWVCRSFQGLQFSPLPVDPHCSHTAVSMSDQPLPGSPILGWEDYEVSRRAVAHFSSWAPLMPPLQRLPDDIKQFCALCRCERSRSESGEKWRWVQTRDLKPVSEKRKRPRQPKPTRALLIK